MDRMKVERERTGKRRRVPRQKREPLMMPRTSSKLFARTAGPYRLKPARKKAKKAHIIAVDVFYKVRGRARQLSKSIESSFPVNIVTNGHTSLYNCSAVYILIYITAGERALPGHFV